VYHWSKANVTVEIDISEVDILSFTEYLATVRISADGVLHHIEMETDSKFAKSIPKQMNMEYYNSDVLRLMYTAGLVSLEDIEESMYALIEENISKMLEKDLKMRVNFNDEFLEFDGNTKEMDNKEPVNFRISASGKMQITEDRLVRMGGFVKKQLELPLQGVKYWNVTYILILPEHINILGRPTIDNTSIGYAGPEINRDSSGRDELMIIIYGEPTNVVEFESLEIEVKVDIDITIWFFLSKILIPIALFIILTILTIVLILYRRHKIKKLDELLKDPDVMAEDESYHKAMGDRKLKRPDRGSLVKEGHIREVESEMGSAEDYEARLYDIMPSAAVKRKGKRGRQKKKYIRKGTRRDTREDARRDTREDTRRGRKRMYKRKPENHRGRRKGSRTRRKY
jgi:hypothetical protein